MTIGDWLFKDLRINFPRDLPTGINPLPASERYYKLMKEVDNWHPEHYMRLNVFGDRFLEYLQNTSGIQVDELPTWSIPLPGSGVDVIT